MKFVPLDKIEVGKTYLMAKSLPKCECCAGRGDIVTVTKLGSNVVGLRFVRDKKINLSGHHMSNYGEKWKLRIIV